MSNKIFRNQFTALSDKEKELIQKRVESNSISLKRRVHLYAVWTTEKQTNRHGFGEEAVGPTQSLFEEIVYELKRVCPSLP